MMPIELRELTIKIAVGDPSQATTSAAVSGSETQSSADDEAVLQRCVEEVMKALQDQKER